MFGLLLIPALLAFATANPVEPKIDPHGSWRVVGGNDAALGAYPFMASLRATSGAHFCGGTIVSNRYILTAAHCLMGQFPGVLTVRVGTNYVNGGGILVATSRLILHPDFTGSDVNNDIGLVELATLLIFSDTVAPIALNTEPIEATAARLLGWGRLETDGPIPLLLQELSINAIPNDVCQNTWGEIILDQHICAVTNYNEGACQGDSGGPLVSESSGEQIGVVMFGAQGGCAQGLPDVYARVSVFVDWIESYIAA